ncbi:MAG: DUF47 family protein [Candidatus Thorarchaeota archaeon]|nr:MAG: DUF47 family protein [Candidatus Thorarchaeota archaeon]
MAFSRIFGSGDKKLQKRADELLLKLSKDFQAASAKLHAAAKAWSKGDVKVLEEIVGEIIEIEREADCLKDELVNSIFSKHAYLPQQTQDRHELVMHMDAVIDAAEEAIRLMAIGKKRKPPKLLVEIAEKCWYCTDMLQDAIKLIFIDFDAAVELSHKIEKVREEARSLKFKLHDRLFNDPKCDPIDSSYYHHLSRRIIDVAIQAEITSDFIRALAVKYS